MVANNRSYCQVQDFKIDLTSLSIRGLIKQKIRQASLLLSIITKNPKLQSIPLYHLKHPSKIIYRCSLACHLSKHFSISPDDIAQDLLNQLKVMESCTSNLPQLTFTVSLTPPAWIDFYLSELSIALWLEQFPRLFFSLTKPLMLEDNILERQLNTTKIFSIQYNHARCCALLRLAHQDNLIKLKSSDFHDLDWFWLHPEDINFIDYNQEQMKLITNNRREYSLIKQIITVIEELETIKPSQLCQAVKHLSDAFWEFEKYCRIWGETKENRLEIALARLKLVAITQSLLFYLLKTKIQVIPLQEF